jgi:4-hydroxythreonine-4-phosphate dehydrogenase
VGILTTHIPLQEVSAALSEAGIQSGARLLHKFLKARETRDLGHPPRLALAGLNPHLGDDGLAGDEDQRLLGPTAAGLRAEGIDLQGPISAESVFWRAQAGAFDGVLALYHDQAMIPVRLLDFAHTVNVTVGLPYWRVSPAHGVAYDLAWRGQAQADSCLAAIELAMELG